MAKEIAFFEASDEGKRVAAGTMGLRDGVATWLTPPSESTKRIVGEKVRVAPSFTPGERDEAWYTPKDGEKYLLACLEAFHGSYFWAEKVRKKKDSQSNG